MQQIIWPTTVKPLEVQWRSYRLIIPAEHWIRAYQKGYIKLGLTKRGTIRKNVTPSINEDWLSGWAYTHPWQRIG